MKRNKKAITAVLLLTLLLAPQLLPQAKAAIKTEFQPMIVQEDIDAAYTRLKEAKEGDRVIVWADQITGIPTLLLSAIAGRNVTMVFEMIDYRWEINGLSVGELPADRDNYYLKIRPAAEQMPGLSPEIQIMQFETPYRGQLPFLAKLTYPVGKQYGNKLLNLYQFDKEKNKVTYATMAFVHGDGAITLPFRAGGYFAITSELVPGEGLDLFYDTGSHWAKNEIGYVSTLGLFTGIAPNIFSPEGGMTRGMFVTLLGRLYGVQGTGTGGFSDVNEGDYWAPYISWAKESGIVSGITNDTFGPGLLLTREQAAVILENFLVKEFGFSGGQDTPKTTYADDGQISSWAKKSVAYMKETGLMKGTGYGFFSPALSMTRAEGAAVLSRMIQEFLSA